MNQDLPFINQYQKETALLGYVLAGLGWDQLTYMPEKALDSRSEQISYLSHLIHKKTIDDSLYAALQRLKKRKDLTSKQLLILKKVLRDVEKSRKLPEEFVKKLSKTTSLAYQAWQKARDTKDFKVFQPYLQEIVELKKQECAYIKKPGHPYNSLLDSFEEGMTVEKLKPVFEKLRKELIVLLRKIQQSEVYRKQKKTLLGKKLPLDKQKELCYDLIKRVGLTDDASRLDLSTHPFTQTLGVHDVRITTNFRDDPLFSFDSTLHEAGHALYELQLPEEDAYTVLGIAPSLGIHESQSRFWENMIGKSRCFWNYYFPKFKKTYGLKGNFEQMYREINFVHPHFIRIESDEVTYCLHIILRFELELGLLEGSLKVHDLPKVWNAKMKEYLGITPKNDVEGVLQDMHWSQGAIGYFPTYALGTIYAAQLYEQLVKEHPSVEREIARGDYTFIQNWLKSNVHRVGSKMLADEIIQKICGTGLNVDSYIHYLNQKYSQLYNFKN